MKEKKNTSECLQFSEGSLAHSDEIYGSNAVGRLSKYDLLGVVDQEISKAYNDVFEKASGPLSLVEDNDVRSKFDVAIATLNPNPLQISLLYHFLESFASIENEIDPNRLNFEITKAMDDEICITKTSELGVSKIILNDDGVVALSFISFKSVDKKDVLDFYTIDNLDYEGLSFSFLSC
jgi:hypothetical protein